MTEFKKGDLVSIMATVCHTEGEYAYFQPVGGISIQGLKAEALTLVERPKREITVTLTEDQLRYLERISYAHYTTEHSDYVEGAWAQLSEALDG